MSLEALTAQGWRAERHTLTAAQTYLWGILFALPFVLLAGGLYRMLLLECGASCLPCPSCCWPEDCTGCSCLSGRCCWTTPA